MDTCAFFRPPRLSFFWGDPHITTMDQVSYTFNGLGEYTLLQVSNDRFVLQGRTGLAVAASGSEATNATVFTAVAARDNDSDIVTVRLDSTRQHMEIFINNESVSSLMINSNHESFNYVDLDYDHVNESLNISFASGFALTVSKGIQLLRVFVVCPAEYTNMTLGLLGIYNNDPDDDFALPNGTVLSINATDEERIYYEFGQKWHINPNESLFYYSPGTGPANFTDSNFVPVFGTAIPTGINQTTVDEAKRLCGDSKQCIFDFLRTRSLDVAKDTKETQLTNEEQEKTVENRAPVISGPSVINIIANQQNEIFTTFVDPDGDNLTFVETAVLSLGANTSIVNDTARKITWTPSSFENKVNLSVTVKDGKGGVATSVFAVNMCSGCNGKGTCDFNTILEDMSDVYKVVKCDCFTGYGGDHCSTLIDWCAAFDQCPEQTTCTTLPPELQNEANHTYFTCSACPAGYEQRGSKCIDVDECAREDTNNCTRNTSVCVNLVGSYYCNCTAAGFRNDANDPYTCQDVDECQEGTSGCVQVCNNTEGHFKCSCFDGYTLFSDGVSCTPTQPQRCQDLNCDQLCLIDPSGQPACGCYIGYRLIEGFRCIDINECEDNQLNKCSQKLNCKNTDGGYQCHCDIGYQLSTDQRTCVGCTGNTWGVNCSRTCDCGDRATECDPAIGCTGCTAGWTGTECDTDVDECATTPGICGDRGECVNNLGSYDCVCPSGYMKSQTGSCNDIDECLLGTYQCQATCVNTAGSYKCACNDGYRLVADGFSCEDVDECSGGTHLCEYICDNKNGSYSCACYDGFQLNLDDGHTCVKIPDYPDNCAANGVNCTYGCDGVACICPLGYTLAADGVNCDDVDECSNATLNRCDPPTACVNNNGSYTCQCATGYSLDTADSRTCRDIDECMDTPCGPHSLCNNTDGAYTCNCDNGYRKNGSQCVNIDECAHGPCGANADCRDTSGSYSCTCKTGFHGDGIMCSNVDECTISDPCSINAQCTDLTGSYICSCNEGFFGDGVDCRDVDECAANSFNCTALETCVNTVGSYYCVCSSGYKRNVTSGRCEDIDECSVTSTCSVHATCSNGQGTFTCACNDGYVGDGFTCFGLMRRDIRLRLLVPYLTEYGDVNSQQYRSLMNAISSLYSGLSGFSSVKIIGISGSIIVDHQVEVRGNITDDTIAEFVTQRLISTNYRLNSSDTVFPVIGVPEFLDGNVTDPIYKCEVTPYKCQNGGRCVQEGRGYCSCPSGWQGDQCETSSELGAAMIAVIVMATVLGALLIGIIVVLCCRICRRRQRRSRRMPKEDITRPSYGPVTGFFHPKYGRPYWRSMMDGRADTSTSGSTWSSSDTDGTSTLPVREDRLHRGFLPGLSYHMWGSLVGTTTSDDRHTEDTEDQSTENVAWEVVVGDTLDPNREFKIKRPIVEATARNANELRLQPESYT
ncbi:neurogenic locus notch homolog protein 2-like [Lingula anatina]|uniref:Neurogenic locus notch homolog protein 2-like n=1 Tax=Lingula anatina TaxID=7574 RepID=A0A1S3I4V6_LINAN|nr:neurogenic locus notch homolog protein 2-like [Lingula anatina]|eukprot:XP_013392399.1 neurogenic locus notch homolog protein 2-like [Lingula anatina]